ncbi:LysR family transcriptional regulator [Citricoccus alkalitolerans]|uniref:LysR family transcriptional regulator n=1 Tax=Citricoccus alkalitolerans TaxID=246603 RepID=A0ABV8XWE9_9MICC
MPLGFTLRQLEYFHAVASEGSMAAAAERSHVTASALALALDDLERHLGLQLLVRRRGHGATLTRAGSRVLALSQGVLSGAERLAEEAANTSDSLTGRFTLGCFPTLAPFYVPAVMDACGTRYPGLELEIVEAPAPELHRRLLQGSIDTALMYRVDVSSQLHIETVHAYWPSVLVHAGHRLAGRGRIHLADIAADPLIALDVQPTLHNTEQLFSTLGLEPRIGFRTPGFETARGLVGRGLGYAVMFQVAAMPTSYDGHAVVPLPLADPVPATDVVLARALGSQATARHRAVAEVVADLGPATGR